MMFWCAGDQVVSSKQTRDWPLPKRLRSSSRLTAVDALMRSRGTKDKIPAEEVSLQEASSS